VLVAIVVGCTKEVRDHRGLAARAILITWAANYGTLMLGREVMTELFRHRLLAYHPQLAMWAICFLGGLASGLIVALLHRGHRNVMLLTGAAALLGWALIAIVFLKTGSLQHPLLQIAWANIVYYLVALTGFAIGGFCSLPLQNPARRRRGTLRLRIDPSILTAKAATWVTGHFWRTPKHPIHILGGYVGSSSPWLHPACEFSAREEKPGLVLVIGKKSRAPPRMLKSRTVFRDTGCGVAKQ
jgi:hypothetical protein